MNFNPLFERGIESTIRGKITSEFRKFPCDFHMNEAVNVEACCFIIDRVDKSIHDLIIEKGNTSVLQKNQLHQKKLHFHIKYQINFSL